MNMELAGIPQQLLAAHNQARGSKRPLVLHPQLQQAAQSHADFMAKRGKMAHFGIGDGDPWTRITAAGYRYSSASENAAWNQQDVATVMSDWMSSPGHRANILGAYRDFGGAVAYGSNQDPFWCTVFGAVGQGQPQPIPQQRPGWLAWLLGVLRIGTPSNQMASAPEPGLNISCWSSE